MAAGREAGAGLTLLTRLHRPIHASQHHGARAEEQADPYGIKPWERVLERGKRRGHGRCDVNSSQSEEFPAAEFGN